MPYDVTLAQLSLDLTEDIIIALNREGSVIEINRKGCEILGYPKADIINRNWFDFFLPPEIRDDVKNRFQGMLQGTISLEHYENPILTAEGTRRIISWHNILLHDKTGQIIGTLSSGEDITEQKRLYEQLMASERRIRTTLDNALEGFQILDFSWRYVYLNDAAAGQGRRKKEELLGHTIQEMYPEITGSRLFSVLQDAMKNRVSHHIENEFTYPDGSKSWFELHINPVPEGLLIFSTDITQRKKLEEELDNYNRRLEVIVAERTEEFARANEKLKLKIAEHEKAEEGLGLRATILDNAGEAIFLLNLQGVIAYANQSAREMYGYSEDELLNMNLGQFLRPRETQIFESWLKEIIEKSRLEMETIHRRKDGSLIPVHVYHKLIKTQHGEFIVSVIRDSSTESHLRSILQEIPAILLVTDNELRLTLVTGTALKKLGLQPERGKGKLLSEYLFENHLDSSILNAHQAALAGLSADFQFTDKQSRTIYQGWASPLRDITGNAIGTLSAAVQKPDRHTRIP